MEINELENKLSKLEQEIKEVRTELSIAIEFYAEVREFLNDLLQLAKTSEEKKQELGYSKPTSILSSTSNNIKPKSRIDQLMDRCINLIFADYKQQSEKR